MLATSREILNSDPAQALQLVPTADQETLLDLLLQPPSARIAISALQQLSVPPSEPVADAVSRLLRSGWSSARLAAIEHLGQHRWLVAAGGLPKWQRHELLDRCLRIVAQDSSWTIRQAALRMLDQADVPLADLMISASDPHWRVRHSLIEAIEGRQTSQSQVDQLLEPHLGNERVAGVHQYLTFLKTGQYPEHPHAPAPEPQPSNRGGFEALNEPDAAVMVRELEALDAEEQEQSVPEIAELMFHREERVRRAISKILLRYAQPEDLTQLVTGLSDPREFGAATIRKLLDDLGDARRIGTAEQILASSSVSAAQVAWAIAQLPVERLAPYRQRLAEFRWDAPESQPIAVAVLRSSAPERLFDLEFVQRNLRSVADSDDCQLQLAAAAWLVETDSPARASLAPVAQRLAKSPHGEVRAAAVVLRIDEADGAELSDWLEDPHPAVRESLARHIRRADCSSAAEVNRQLQQDPHPLVRAAGLTPQLAQVLMEDPTRETSWLVVRTAAQIRKTPEWKVPLTEQQPAQPSERPAAKTEIDPFDFGPLAFSAADYTSLGAKRIKVSRMGLSGHYHLPETGFAIARDCGINLMFWEPNYDSMTRYLHSLTAAQRSEIHLIAGSFEATAGGVQKDIERVLRVLKLERISFFLMFWVRSWRRMTDEVVETLERFRGSGAIENFSLSTHNRELAVEAIDRGYDPVMVRHSLAHRGAEQRIFAAARDAGTTLITFNNTCYGRLLQPIEGHLTPTAAECYRYSLSQPAVATCLTAPATIEQLHQNLSALKGVERPSGTDETRLAGLLRHGEAVYQRDRVFMKTVRSR